MTLHAYQQSVFSGSDTVAVAPFARITVTNASDDSAASIWSDAAGANPIADGVLLADENGYFIFYADEGTYNIAILSDGISKTLENVEIGVGNPYSGQFRGTWDMSSGVFVPAVPSASQAATYTPTTMTPDGTIPGVDIPYIAGVETSALPIGTNVMQASMPMPAYTPGDTVNSHYLVLCNSSATISDVRDVVAGNTPANPTYAAIAVEASGVLAYPFVSLVIYNNGATTGGNAGAVVAGDVSYLRLDPTTNDITLQVGSTTVGPFTLDVGSFPPGDTIKLMVLTQSASSTVVFAASTVSFNLSDTTGGRSGFGTITNATLPVGALDNDWYEVSAGGYFHGKTTRAGQFVKLIRGKTDLIVVDKPADPGTSTVEAVTVTHFSDINTTGVTDPRLYVVTADETNANQRTQYLFDGSALMWLVALEA